MGKSDLINEMLDEETVKTSWGGSKGTTDKLEIYESEVMPFNIIDTVGFEPPFFPKTRWLIWWKNGQRKAWGEKMRTARLIIIVITKYSSVLGKQRNIKMVRNVFAN